MKNVLIIGISFLFLFGICKGTATAENPKVLMKTSKGDLTIELYQDKAPISVENFLNYVDEKFYEGTIFHRVIKDFMIQGGGFTPDLQKKTTNPPIKNEATNGLSNKRGTLAMARLPQPHSASAQFFINHKNNSGLDHKGTADADYGYCVFGKVIEGMDVVDAIAKVKTMTKNNYRDVPREDILIISVERL